MIDPAVAQGLWILAGLAAWGLAGWRGYALVRLLNADLRVLAEERALRDERLALRGEIEARWNRLVAAREAWRQDTLAVLRTLLAHVPELDRPRVASAWLRSIRGQRFDPALQGSLEALLLAALDPQETPGPRN